jgi:chromosome segregation ATPase
MTDPDKDYSRALDSLERQISEFSKQIERAASRIEEVYRHLADGKTKSATQEIEILHVKQAVEEVKHRVNALEDSAATQKHISDAIAPISQAVQEMRGTQTWLVRLIIGSVITAVLALLGIGIVK